MKGGEFLEWHLHARLTQKLLKNKTGYRLLICNPLILLVGAVGFELTTLCSQSRCATRLRYAPKTDNIPEIWKSAKTPGDVILGFLALGFDENLVCLPKFHQFTQIHKGRKVRHPGSLLHVVGDDRHGVIGFQFVQ